MTPNEKAERAKQLLADPVLKHAFGEIREALVGKLENAGVDDVTTHHEVALTLQLLKRLQTQLHRYIDDQKLVEHRNNQSRFIDRIRQTIIP